MTTATDIRKRRVPQRKRAQATVDFILEATQLLILESGYSNLTTNAIAEKAGVNIASLYRYFPNREAIVVALYENITTKIAKQMKADIGRAFDQDIATSMPRLLKTLYELHLKHEAIVVRLKNQVPQLRDAMQPYDLGRLVHGAARTYFELHNKDCNYADVETALYFATNNILANIRDYVQEKPSHISKKVFIQELSKSVIAYLTGYPEFNVKKPASGTKKKAAAS